MAKLNLMTATGTVLLLSGVVAVGPAAAASPTAARGGGGARTTEAATYDAHPVLGAAFPGISGAVQPGNLARSGAAATGRAVAEDASATGPGSIQAGNYDQAANYDAQPVAGAAYPGISSGVERGKATLREQKRVGNRAAETMVASGNSTSNQAVYYYDTPVPGAAYPGASGGLGSDGPAPSSRRAAAPGGPESAVAAGGASSDQPANYDTQPVLGAAYPGISASAAARGIAPRRVANVSAAESRLTQLGSTAEPAGAPQTKSAGQAPAGRIGSSATASRATERAASKEPAAQDHAAEPKPQIAVNEPAKAPGNVAESAKPAAPASAATGNSQAASNQVQEPQRQTAQTADSNGSGATQPAPAKNAGNASTASKENASTTSKETKTAALTPPANPAAAASAHPTLEPAQLQKMVGETVVNRDGQPLGQLEKVVSGPNGQVEKLVIEHGGFFGLFVSHSEVDWRQTKAQIEGNRLVLALTPEQVASAPAYSGG